MLTRQSASRTTFFFSVFSKRSINEHIIDIGCGCGQTSLALAARVRPTGSVR